MRRIFVTNDGKDPVDSLCEGFLEMSCNMQCRPNLFTAVLRRMKGWPCEGNPHKYQALSAGVADSVVSATSAAFLARGFLVRGFASLSVCS